MMIFQSIPTIMMIVAPILITAIGGMICEKSGVVNIALEGLMSIGACTAASVHFLMEAAGCGRYSLAVALLAIKTLNTPILSFRIPFVFHQFYG